MKRHGNYAYLCGCRCDICREAHRVRGADYRARQKLLKEKEVPRVHHEQTFPLRNWGDETTFTRGEILRARGV